MDRSQSKRGPRLTPRELKAAAAEMRAMNLVSIFAAGSGHPGGALSVMDIAAALYLNELNHDPANPDWAERARDVCAKCRVQWGRVNDNFFFLCRDCREITVVC
jgi:transketolase N-terminal domain/subunit